MTNRKCEMTNKKWWSSICARWLMPGLLLLAASTAFAPTPAPAPQTQTPDLQSVIARQASLVTEYDVNGMKVLVKRREGSQTVAVQLYIRGGAANISTANAGVEALMLNVASEASTGFPRERMRKELARMGSVIGESVNYDYSALSMAATRANFDRSWDVFTDVALHPA